MIFYGTEKKDRTEYMMMMMNPLTSGPEIASRHERLHNNPCPVVSLRLISVWGPAVRCCWGLLGLVGGCGAGALTGGAGHARSKRGRDKGVLSAYTLPQRRGSALGDSLQLAPEPLVPRPLSPMVRADVLGENSPAPCPVPGS